MEIVFITGSMHNGGAERVISVLANEFVKSKHQIKIKCLYKNKIDYVLDKKIDVVFVEHKSSFIPKQIKVIHELNKYLKREKPDLIISFVENINMISTISNLYLNIPHISSVRNDPSKEPKSKILRYIRTLLYKKVDHIVFQTVDAKNYFPKKIQQKSSIILNPINSNYIRPRYKGIRKKKIVTVARLDKQKNLKFLIEVFKKISSFYDSYTLHIYGDGPQKEDLENFIIANSLEKKVFLEGFVNETFLLLEESSLFMLLSLYEGLPNALIEAMALGLPCISSDCPVGGPRMLIENKVNGILVPVNDFKKTCEAVEFLLDNINEANKMGDNARNIILKVDNEVIINDWMKLIEDLLI